MRKYYFDTSIWLDFFENRDEPGLPKSRFVRELTTKIISEECWIVYSDVVVDELIEQSYNLYELNTLFKQFDKILIYIESNKKQFGKAKDLAKKRWIPIFDALHALIARDNRALMVTRDKHFNQLKDIADYKKPEEII